MNPEITTALVTIATGALALVVKRYVPLDRISDWLSRASEVVDEVDAAADEAVSDMHVILEEQRAAYDHLRERFEEQARELEAKIEELEHEITANAVLAEALEVASSTIAEMVEPDAQA